MQLQYLDSSTAVLSMGDQQPLQTGVIPAELVQKSIRQIFKWPNEALQESPRMFSCVPSQT